MLPLHQLILSNDHYHQQHRHHHYHGVVVVVAVAVAIAIVLLPIVAVKTEPPQYGSQGSDFMSAPAPTSLTPPSILIPMAVVHSITQKSHKQTENNRNNNNNNVNYGDTKGGSGAFNTNNNNNNQQYGSGVNQGSSNIINHGFMSSFLMSEKGKLYQNNGATGNQQQSSSDYKQGANGNQLMAIPIAHMPDNMIGQAYNAAVGQALPIDSGEAV